MQPPREVVEVLEPGRTLSLMICTEGHVGDWGYLAPQTGEVEATSRTRISGPGWSR